MTPKDAYDHIAARARRMLRFHDGLVNLRKYKMRSDWQGKFAKVMQWPKNKVSGRIDSVEAVIVLKEGASLTSADFTADAIDDLLRSALAVGIGALDRYVHERIAKDIVGALSKSGLTSAQRKLTVSAPLALQMAHSQRLATKAGKKVRPANQFRIAFQASLHRRTFQSSAEIEEAFQMIGVSGIWGALQKKRSLSTVEPLRKQLDEIARRRNLIVHEGDLVRHERGGKPRVNAITKRYVHDSLACLDALVADLDSLP